MGLGKNCQRVRWGLGWEGILLVPLPLGMSELVQGKKPDRWKKTISFSAQKLSKEKLGAWNHLRCETAPRSDTGPGTQRGKSTCTSGVIQFGGKGQTGSTSMTVFTDPLTEALPEGALCFPAQTPVSIDHTFRLNIF